MTCPEPSSSLISALYLIMNPEAEGDGDNLDWATLGLRRGSSNHKAKEAEPGRSGSQPPDTVVQLARH